MGRKVLQIYLTMDKMKMSSPVLPPGFRFHPTDQELIIHYLQKKISSSSNPEVSIIADINIYKFNPWELPGKASFGETEWFFFSPRDRKYPNGARPNRAAASGYWKATGTDKPILSSNGSQCLGVKKALVFYKGRPPKGTKTNWMMLEYRLLDDTHQLHRLRGSMRLDDWVLCRVRRKSSSPQLKEESYESTAWAGSFPSNYLGSLQGQDMKVNMSSNTLREYDYLFQTCINKAPLEQEETVDQQGEGSPGSSVTAVDSACQPSTVSSLKEALESIRKVLSINAIEDMSPVPPKKRLHVSTASNAEKESIFQLSSPNIAASIPRNFSGFLI